jgi:DNA-binding GntR family transcriptional regulator
VSNQLARKEVGSGNSAKRVRSAGDAGIYNALYEAILDHRLPPGTKLTEDGLGEVFGVSRTVVRKVLHRLSHENIVSLRPNRGAVVASPSVAEAREVFEARRVVETAVIRVLSRLPVKDELGRLRRQVREEHRAHERGDRRSFVRLSGRFHVDLARMAGNEVLARFLKELVSRTSLIIALYEIPGSAACSFDEHLALIDAMEDGQGGRAVKLMEQHLAACESKLNLEQDEAAVDVAQVFAEAAVARV